MASATLNSNIVDALSRSSAIEPHTQPSHPIFPSPTQIQSAINLSETFLAKHNFHSQLNEYIDQENSTSGGEATTEDEEVNCSEQYLAKRSAQDSPRSSKKRRKQVKPIRLTSMENNTDNHPVNDSLGGSSFFDEASQQNDSAESMTCPHCRMDFQSEDSLRRHIIEDHIGRMLSEEELRRAYAIQEKMAERREQMEESGQFSEREEGEMTPLNLTSSRWDRKSHGFPGENGERSPGVSLPSSLRVPPSYVDAKFGLPSLVPLGPPPFLFPFLHQHPSMSAERERLHANHQNMKVVGNGQPIFNLEAYCDLCNKEFCNKYFLKTHKANKHGIYNPDIGSPQMSVSSSTPAASFATIANSSSLSSTPLTSTPLSIPNHQTSPLSSIPLPGSPFPNAFLAANLPPLPLRPVMPHLTAIQKTSLQINKSDSNSSSKNGIVNVEAYCEICQKEFCNKYFLKRHKSKIHNIDIEVTIKSISKVHDGRKPGYDRPDGWCDACRKDIGSRALLNSHKLNAHGPHIVMHLPPTKEQNSPMDFLREAKESVENNGKVNENFSPWDFKRSEEASKQAACSENGETIRYEKEPQILKEGVPANSERWERLDAREDKRPQGWLEEKDSSYSSLNKNDQDKSIKEEPTSSNSEEPIDPDREEGEVRIHKDIPACHQSLPHELREHDFRPSSSTGKDVPDERDPNITPIRNSNPSDTPRTPGGGSSTDENSRELGLIARVGQPAIAQPSPGTKFTPDQLRQLGVVNADAFCEICCKEFCNKYFLRTHRIKKHGIYTPEYSDRSKQVKDPSPLTLAKILERQSLELRSNMDIDIDTECEMCHRPFPNPYLLQMHKYYIHGPGQEVLQQQEHMMQLQQSSINSEHLRQLALQSHHHNSPKKNKHHHKAPEQKIESNLVHKNDSSLFGDDRLLGEAIMSLKSASSQPTPEIVSQVSPRETLENRLPFVGEGSQDLDTSEELRKLQTMILELNRHGEGTTKCKICQKDVGNKYFMRAHLMTEHGILPQNDFPMPHEQNGSPRTSREGTPISSPGTTPNMDNHGFCNICKKDLFSRFSLQQHMLTTHGIFPTSTGPTSFLDRIRAEIESRDERKPVSTSRSYCEICNKELCNKYFMKTHMLKMHGINIENGTSGGVTCDICRKELCSKYFLKVHKQNTHGLLEDTNEDGQPMEDGIEAKTCPLCARRFKNVKWLQTHLNSDHGEEGKAKWQDIESKMPPTSNILPMTHGCSICGCQLPDLVALQIHLIKNHGNKPDDNSMDNTEPRDVEGGHTCSVCHMTFPTPQILFAHESTHTPTSSHQNPFLSQSQILPCPFCSQSISSLEQYQQHLIHHQLEGFLKPLLNKAVPEAAQTENIIDKGHIETKTPPNEKVSTTENIPAAPRKRWRCPDCGKKFKSRGLCLAHIQSQHPTKFRTYGLGRVPNRKKMYKCRKCGALAKKLSTLRKHIKKQHPNMPTGHAQPTHATGQFVMQPFLLSKEDGENPPESDGEEQTFVPSLVYLPVAKKVQRPLTVSFCLTPA